MDRSEGYNAVGGPVGADVTTALYRGKCTAETVNIFYGLSGRDITVAEMVDVYDGLAKLADGKNVFDEYPYLGLRK